MIELGTVAPSRMDAGSVATDGTRVVAPGRVRPRRLRRSAALRDLVAETSVRSSQLMMPHFVLPAGKGQEPIPSMPGISRFGVDDLVRQVEADRKLGVRAVLLFGVPPHGAKDPEGRSSHDPEGAVPRALRALKRALGPDVTVFTDVCLCAYTDHGHCGLLKDGEVDNDSSLGPLAAMALAGMLLRSGRTPEEKTNGLFVMGAVMLALGLIWGGAFPINKSIWTSSYVLFAGGFASLTLALCYWTADVHGWRWWTKPFVVYGTNALALYFLSAIVTRLILWIIPSPAGGGEHFKDWLYHTAFVPFFSPINASLAWALFYVLAWLGIMWIFYAKRIFIKV